MLILRLAALGLIVFIAACSPSPTEQSLARETAQLNPMRAEYQNAVTGFTFDGTRLDVAIDLNQYSNLDEDSEDAIKAESMKRWVDAWKAENPDKHATLTLRLIDYFGKPFYTATQKV